MRTIVLIAHNLRSTHNVGSLLRTADGLGVDTVYLTGYTPYPLAEADGRLPHISQKIASQIHKTALGAEKSVNWKYIEDIAEVIAILKKDEFDIVALEQIADSIELPRFKPTNKCALIVGREVEGIEPEVVAACNSAVAIPMFGKKESFNVVQAAAMAMYHCRFTP